jgi:LPXTG-site transpeptidase (sortase) family protein
MAAPGRRRSVGICLIAVTLTGCGLTWDPGGDGVIILTQEEREEVTVPAATSEQPAAQLTIPSLGLHHVPVFNRGTDAKRRMQIAGGFAVTHYLGSASLGGGSNSVLYGHDDMEGSVFGHLADLRPAAQVILALPSQDIQTYVVSAAPRRVGPRDTSILGPSHSAQLTLFTCYPNFIDTDRIVVTASLVPQAA